MPKKEKLKIMLVFDKTMCKKRKMKKFFCIQSDHVQKTKNEIYYLYSI